MQLKTYDIRFQHPSSHLITGPSGSGKTFRTYSLLKHKNSLFVNGETISHVIMCYAQWQPIYDQMKNEKIVHQFIPKLPSPIELQKIASPYVNKGGCIVVFDDFQGQIGKGLDEIVRVTARHNQCTIFILFQTIFPQHTLARSISLNIKYLHVHKQPREANQISTLAYQMNPSTAKASVQIFHDITNERYSCLLYDLTQECPEHLRIRSHYLPSEYPPLTHIPKSLYVPI